MPKTKRRLKPEEIKQIRAFLLAPGPKPSLKDLARKYGVNRPSIVKSLGGAWPANIHGVNLPPPPSFPKTKIETKLTPVIEPFTIKLDDSDV